MAATKDQIREWLKQGQQKGATHVLVVCDQFDWEDYPVYVMPDSTAQEHYESICAQSMQKVMEIYDLSTDIEAQLAQERAWTR